eukprot:CAMPEP_0114254428 /NCGR_PEP_ID=MMETSP0058-20121206/16971_1 /TAXON_ID=36894 /ORGANISM="Pyramimonas parkeae, CCMP726" /LENGTH=295 /DNA_ID=CAMNT_0001368641 /DNA_START=62 /DNA_END=949 /DNA_ORIENTATION=-
MSATMILPQMLVPSRETLPGYTVKLSNPSISSNLLSQMAQQTRSVGIFKHRPIQRTHGFKKICKSSVRWSSRVFASLGCIPPRPESRDFSTHRFADFANWLVPGVVLLGRYPYVEPSRCFDDATGAAQIAQVASSMDPTRPLTYVCLQDELPSQSDSWSSFEHSGGVFKPYYSTAIEAAEANNASTPEFLHFRIVDLSVPTLEQLQFIVQELGKRLNAGHQLYIHCWGGRGRAGLVGASLLSQLYPGISADEALDHLQAAYDQRNDDQRQSPETQAQRAVVAAFYDQLLALAAEE